jgi:hypothetical protein
MHLDRLRTMVGTVVMYPNTPTDGPTIRRRARGAAAFTELAEAI